MSKQIKRPLIVMLMLLFLMQVTGLVLAVHVHLEGGHDHHDEGHCPVCQILFDVAGKVISVSFDILAAAVLIVLLVIVNAPKPLSFQYELSIAPRAPPII